MELSQAEKLILLMLSDLQIQLEVRGEVDPNFVKSAVLGHPWALEWEYSAALSDDDVSSETASEAGQIMTMWRTLEDGFGALSDEEKARVRDSIPSHLKLEFPGFDGNEESHHYSAATFMVEEMGRFSEWTGRSLNSHYPTLDRHRAMLERWREIVRRSASAFPLSADQIIEIVGTS